MHCRPTVPTFTLSLVLACTAGCGPSVGGGEIDPPVHVDAGSPTKGDAGTEVSHEGDAGEVRPDAASPGFDAGSAGLDAGTAVPDAGIPVVDAGGSVADGGSPRLDAGSPGLDAGLPGRDAGSPGFDAGNNGTDAGSLPDRTNPSRPFAVYAFPAGPRRVDVSWIPANDAANTIGEAMSGVVAYRVLRNGTEVATVDTHFFSDTSAVPQTDYAYTIHSIDGVGRVSGGTQAVLNTVTTSVDPSPLSASITSPTDGATVSEVVPIRVVVASSSGSTPRVTLTIDGDMFGGPNSPVPYERNLYTRNLSDGRHVLRAYASDAAGGSAYAEVIIHVANEPEAPEPDPALPAFPGAEGFGAGATGGRGGAVVYVTNLNTEGPGSLNAALAMSGPRYVLSKVSGLVNEAARIVHGNLTYAGHTSPGGLYVRGIFAENRNNPAERRDNMILRHVRSRPNMLRDDAFRIGYGSDIIIDHGSFARANDECGQVAASYRFTLQNCIFAETIGGHFNLGGILMKYASPAFPLDKVSVHHNLFTRIGGRFPEFGYNDEPPEGWNDNNSFAFHKKLRAEVSNNLYWDIGSAMTISNVSMIGPYMIPMYADFQLNFVQNYMHVKPEKPFGMMNRLADKSYLQALHLSGNRMNTSSLQDYQLIGNNGIGSREHPLDAARMGPVQLTPRYAYAPITYDPVEVLQPRSAEQVGAFPRDVMDLRLMHYVEQGTIDSSNMWGVVRQGDGTLQPTTTAGQANTGAGFNPYDQQVTDLLTGQRVHLAAGELVDDAFYVTWSTPPVPPLDSDDDGMPDAWELHNGLDPLRQDHTGKELSVRYAGVQGYDNLECFLNRLSDHLTTGASLTEGAAFSYPVQVTLAVEPARVVAGGSVVFEVRSASEASAVRLSLANLSAPYASPAPAPVSASNAGTGRWTHSITVPSTLPPGRYQVLAHVAVGEEQGYALVELEVLPR